VRIARNFFRKSEARRRLAFRRTAVTALLAAAGTIALGLTGSARAVAQPAARPNILWLIAEDFGPHLGCYGTKEVFTPNLDGLAKRGMRFTRLFTTAPVCSPSRSAFMTGMHQTTIGAQEHRTAAADKRPLPEGVRLLPDWLRDAGYCRRLSASKAQARRIGISSRPSGRLIPAAGRI
jgi:hypothetical protein